MGRSAGFSLDEMALMFAPDGHLHIDRKMLAAKAEELDKTTVALARVACPRFPHTNNTHLAAAVAVGK
jgi:hypothetical protein